MLPQVSMNHTLVHTNLSCFLCTRFANCCGGISPLTVTRDADSLLVIFLGRMKWRASRASSTKETPPWCSLFQVGYEPITTMADCETRRALRRDTGDPSVLPNCALSIVHSVVGVQRRWARCQLWIDPLTGHAGATQHSMLLQMPCHLARSVVH